MEAVNPSLPMKSDPPSRIKRSTLIIKRKLQYKYIVLVMCSVLLAIGLISWDIYYTFGSDMVHDLMDPGLYDLFLEVNQILMAKLLIYLVVVAVVALFVSHKLAGPIFRFERSARIVSGGDLTYRVHLRKGDELMDLQDEFNNMMDSLHAKVSKDRQLSEKLVKQLDDLKQLSGLPPAASARLDEMKSEAKHIGSDFRI
ncbi:MAG TPA: HAMP domain-containing protein [Elusimicrobiota bacterium]|nr:HAMP domain-containing protein [Elusimicrobiota bacterium]